MTAGPTTLQLYLLIATGGAFGASLRYFLFETTFNLLGRGFPYATLLVNILGSFVIGILYGAIQHELITIIPWRTFMGIGFLGALTTFSTFSLDTLLLLQQGDWFKAALNIILNVFVCIFIAWVGMQLIESVAGKGAI
ncbi:MAG: CrcB protein [Alteromonadaceae bacterium]|jgi:CrcB protein